MSFSCRGANPTYRRPRVPLFFQLLGDFFARLCKKLAAQCKCLVKKFLAAPIDLSKQLLAHLVVRRRNQRDRFSAEHHEVVIIAQKLRQPVQLVSMSFQPARKVLENLELVPQVLGLLAPFMK